MGRPLGAMREWLIVISPHPPALEIVSITRVGIEAAVTTRDPHTLRAQDVVRVDGQAPAGYLGRHRVTPTGTHTFTYPCAGDVETPFAGLATVTFLTDAQGGQRAWWTEVGTLAAELLPDRVNESIQGDTARAAFMCTFRVRVTDGITTDMRLLWSPSWSAGPSRRLGLAGPPLPIDDGRTWMALKCVEVTT